MFDELKIKRIQKNGITKENYKKLPYRIQTDSRVIETFILSDINNINYVPLQNIVKLINNNYTLFGILNDDNMNLVFKELDITKITFNQDIFDKLNNRNKNAILKMDICLYLSFLDDKTFSDEFSEIIRNKRMKNDGEYYLDSYIVDDERLQMFVSSLDSDRISLLLNTGSQISKKYVSEVVYKLPKEKQIELYHENSELLQYFPEQIQDEIMLESAGRDLDKISILSLNAKTIYFGQYPDELKFLDDKDIVEILRTGKVQLSAEFFEQIVGYMSMRKVDYAEIFDKCLSDKEKQKSLSKGFYADFWDYIAFVGNQTNTDYIEDIGKYRLKIMDDILKTRLENIKDDEKRQKMQDLYNQMTAKYHTQEHISSISDDSLGSVYNPIYKVLGLMFDDRIIQNNDIELIQKFYETEAQDKNILIELLANGYGSHVREIFEKRPNLKMEHIASLKIFDKKILDNFGESFIHFMLSYNFEKHRNIISSIADSEQKMSDFKRFFDYILTSKEHVDSMTIEFIFEKFNNYQSVLSKLDFDNMTVEQKNNMMLWLSDSNKVGLIVNSVDDINNYIELRTDYFEKKVSNCEDSSELTNIIFEYMTGREVNPEKGTINSMNISNTIEVFNVDKIISNPELISEINLNNDEVALLLLMNQINSIHNISILKDVFTSVEHSKHLNPTKFQSTFDKIEKYYVGRFKNELTSLEDLEKLPCKRENGLTIVELEGEQFNLLCSVLELNLSSNKYSKAKQGTELLDDWLTREDGSSTISTTLCASDMSIYPFGRNLSDTNDYPVFVFDDEVDIIGMGGSDISSSHMSRNPQHSFEYIGYNKMKFASMDEIKKDMSDTFEDQRKTGLEKFLSEITILRKEEDIRKVDTTQKRKMPIGMYVVGELTPELLETAKAFSEYYKEHNLGEFKILRVDPKKYDSKVIDTINSNSYTKKEQVTSEVLWYQEVQDSIKRR